MIEKYKTRQQSAAQTVHHRTGDLPAWSGDPFDWPTCGNCGKQILVATNGTWACVDPECEAR